MADQRTRYSLKTIRLPFRRERRPRVPTAITALDLDGSMLRVAQTSVRNSGPVVMRVVAAPLEFPPDADRANPEVTGRAIARALSQLHISPGSVIMGVPRAQVVLRTLLVPVIDDIEELASVVHMQVGRDLPFRTDEAVIDFRVCHRAPDAPAPAPAPPAAGGPDSGNPKADPTAPGDAPAPAAPQLEVLVAVVKRDVVEFHRQAAEVAGLKLTALGFLPYANARSVQACRVADGNEPFALVSLRPDEVGIDVIADETLRYSRGATVRLSSPAGNAGVGAADAPVTPPEPARNDSFPDLATLEVVRSLHSYGGMEPGRPISKIVVSGATGHEASVVEALSKRLGKPCTPLDPASALNLRPEARDHAAGSIAAIGLTLGLADSRGLPFDFLSPKRPKVHRDMRRIWILSGAAGFAVLTVAVLALRSQLVARKTKLLNDANAELAEAEKKRPTYRRMILQAGAIDDWLKGGRDWLDHYAYLTAILPPSEDVYVTSFTVSAQGSIRLAVQAQSGEILAKLDQKLRAAGYDVKPLAITPGADRFGYEFRSNVELIPTPRLKIDLSRAKPPARPSDDGSLDPALYRKGGG